MTDLIMPSMGENVKVGLVVAIVVRAGETVKEGQTLLEVETDKVTFEIPAEAAGEIVEVLVTKGAKVAPGDILATLKTKSVEPANGVVVSELPNTLTMAPAISTLLEVTNPVEMQATNNNRAPEISFPYGDKKVVTTPLARKLARELDIDISEIQKAVKGRITFLDVKNYAKSQLRQASRNDSVSATVHSPPLPDFERYGAVRYSEMTPMMGATSRNVTVAVSQIPHAWIQEKIDITELEKNQKKHKKQVEAAGGNLTITALLVKAVAQALRVFPLLNASVDMEKNRIITKDYCNIGVAVDTDKGLLVPVIRNADQRNLTEISRELTRISAEARAHKTKLVDMEGGTFTISNLGGIGTTGVNPIVIWPQVCILGLSAGQVEPVWQVDQFVPRLRMPVTLGFDHRVINGADAARFLQYLKKVTEDPFMLLL